ncbi:MAG: Nramp family divalent metal transporter [Anaerolineae bacterium]
MSRLFSRRGLAAALAMLGPGLVSAIAGDDAGGIATYALVGAKYGYTLLWTMVLITISLGVVQEITTRLSVATGKGLSDLIREQFGVKVATLAMAALVIANAAVTISEFVGIAAAGELFGVTRFITVPVSAILVWWIVVRGNYRIAERIFLALALVLTVYVISALVVRPDWGAVARGTFIPTIQTDREFIILTIAVIGTTISPYMQFTLSSTIVEKGVRPDEYRSQLVETLLGVLLSDAFSYFIIVATAATLFVHGIHDIETADQAAQALQPIAGPLAEELFGAGLLGASFLAASVLPLSTTYAVCEAFGWERGVNASWEDAPIFYGLYTALIVVGALIALVPNAPFFLISIVVYDLNGILLPVLLILMLSLASNPRLLGKRVSSPLINVLGWGTTIMLIALTVGLAISAFLP